MSGYKVVGIGNAIVDVIAPADEAFLEMMGIHKGVMQLIEMERAELLFAAMREREETPGGSVANTIAGIGALGLKTGFVGRVADDYLGRGYISSMNDGGTDYLNAPVSGSELPTSRSMIFVTPDGERSMNTYLGTSAEIGPDDVPEEALADAEILFLEGYLFDKPKGKEAFRLAADTVHKKGGKTGIAVSDPLCVERHREDFLRLIEERLDFVIGNESEIQALFEIDTETSMAKLSGICELVVCTRGGEGVSVYSGSERIFVPVEKVVPVDATGAGDQFAAGFLFGLATGKDLELAARMGVVAGAEVIGHIGPRPEQNVMQLFKDKKLI